MTIERAKRQIEALEADVRALRDEGRSDDALEMALSMVALLHEQNTELTLKLAALARERAGRRSERIDPAQLSLMLELAERSDESEASDLAATRDEDERLTDELSQLDPDPSRGNGRRPRRRRPPKDLPRDLFRHELSGSDRRCPGCGTEMAAIGEDVSEVLELVPAHFRVQEHHRVKYACSRCKETVVTAPGPSKLIERGLAGPGLMAHVVQSKFEDHIPLSRLVDIYARGGVELATSTLCGWVDQVADAVKPLVERIWEKAQAAHTLQTDGSGLKVLDRDDPEGVRKGTMWCCVGDRKYVVFRYSPTGSGEDGPWEFLSGREGYLQADAASVFDRLYDGQRADATEVGCWAHARRKFHALKESDARVAYPLKLIAQLYRLEELADARELPPKERQMLRATRAGPILERLWRWLTRTATREPPKSALHKACAYCLNQWEALTQFLGDALLPLDNNLCERQIRSLAVGRKNYLFAGSDAGAERAAILYSLLRTAALEKIDTYAYLIHLINRLADGWPMSRIDELLPENYRPATETVAVSTTAD